MMTISSRRSLFWAGLAIVCSLLTYFLLPHTLPEEGRRVAALFVFAVFFWALEIIPLFATSLLIVILLSFLLVTPGFRLFLTPFSSPVIILFFGGFILAAAVHKHHVGTFLMRRVLTKLGTRSHVVFLGFLFMSAFFSMWISNTAATAMMLVLIKPILDHIEKDDPLRKGIVLATAFGADIGGIGTPISTPPNAIAIGILAENGVEIDFTRWMLMAVPLTLLILAIAAGILLFFFPPKTKRIPYTLPKRFPLSSKGVSVLVIASLMIVLWLTKPLHHIPEALVALLGVGLFSAFQLITKEDLKQINWDILILMWGGLALGEGLTVSGLIDLMLHVPLLTEYTFLVIALFCVLAAALSSLISNTATANLLLPLAVGIASVDKSFLAITVALSCSLSLLFPISTPPNAMAYGTGEIEIKEMFRAGSLITTLSIIIILLGFQYIIPMTIYPH